MAQVARLNDHSDHGGVIISASGNLTVNGVPGARVGDLHSCPRKGHGVTAIVSSPFGSTNGGHAIAGTGSMTGCGAIIIEGSPSVGT